MSGLPVSMLLGSTILYNGVRFKFKGEVGDGYLDFENLRTGGPLQVPDEETGVLIRPDIDWLWREYIAGRFVDPGAARASAAGRQAEFLGLDTSACIARDPKAAWRFRWSWAALKAGVKRSDTEYLKFISLRANDLARDDNLGPPPASTLRRWVRALVKGDARIGSMVSLNGRLKGQSQLCDAEDRMVHEAAAYYWAEEGASIADAHAYLFTEWSNLIENGAEGLGPKCPSYETVRLRVRSLESYDTVSEKFGKHVADAMFNPTGVAIPATHIFERVFMDGTELEQIVVFGDDWPLAASKLKCVYGMDAFSTFVFPPVLFSGPYREEMSILAVKQVMTPPVHYSERDLEEFPDLRWAFGPPNTLIPDNDRTLIGPGYIPGITALGSAVELPGVYHSDAKAIIENCHKDIKAHARRLPGTVKGPTGKKDPKRNPVAEAELTKDSMLAIVEARFLEWNTKPKEHLGDRSPLEVLIESAKAGYGPRLSDPSEVERELSKTINNVVATDDGATHDGITYRGDLGQLLSANYRNTPHADRISGAAKCLVSIRTTEGDIDSIQVYNEEDRSYVTLYSTQPQYTSGLSRWEHNEYRNMAKARREKYDTEGQRLRSRAKSLRVIEETAHKVPFKRRNKMAALYEMDQFRRHSGKRAQAPGFQRELPEDAFLIKSAANIREDVPTSPPGPKSSGSMASKAPQAPERPEGYYEDGYCAETDDGPFSWDDVESDLLDGEEEA